MCSCVRGTIAVSVLCDKPSHITFKNESVHINLSNWESNKRQRYKSLIFSNVGTWVEKFYCSQGLYLIILEDRQNNNEIPPRMVKTKRSF